MKNNNKFLIVICLFSFIGISISGGIRYKSSLPLDDVILINKINDSLDSSTRQPASRLQDDEESISDVVSEIENNPQILSDNTPIKAQSPNEEIIQNEVTEKKVMKSQIEDSDVFYHIANADEIFNKRTDTIRDLESSSPHRIGTHLGSVYFSNSGTKQISRQGNTNDNKESFVHQINSIKFTRDSLIIRGSHLENIKLIEISSSDHRSALVEISNNGKEILAKGRSALKFLAGKAYSLIISDAHGATTYPIEFAIENGSISFEKLAPLSTSEHGHVLTWNAHSESWEASPSNIGKDDSESSSGIVRGVGIVGEGSTVLSSGLISVDIGNDAGQILAFDNDKNLSFKPDNRLIFSDGYDSFVMGLFSDIFKLKFMNDQGADQEILSISQNDFIVFGKSVCLSDGTNCLSQSTEKTTITVASPLMKVGSDDVELSLSLDPLSLGINGTNQLTIKDGAITPQKLSPMNALAGQVLKWNGSSWGPGADENTVTTIATDNTSVGINGSGELSILEGSIGPTHLSSMGASNGQVLRWDGLNWMPSNDSESKVRSFALKDISQVSCASNEMLDFDVITNNFICIKKFILNLGENTNSTSSIRFSTSPTDQGVIRLTTNGLANWIESGLSEDADSSKDLRFSSYLGQTTWMSIEGDSGRVGIGTVTPEDKLHIHSDPILQRSSIRSSWDLPEQYAEWSGYEGNNYMGGISIMGSNRPEEEWRNALLLTAAQNNEGSLILRTRTNDQYHSRVVIKNNGFVGMGLLNPTSALEVNGIIKATGFEGPMSSASISSGNGTASSPAYSFIDSPNTGIFSSSPGVIGVSSQGTQIFNISDKGLNSTQIGGALITSKSGDASKPTLSFNGDDDTGWYRSGANTLSAATAGIQRMTIKSNGDVSINGSIVSEGTSVKRNGSLDIAGYQVIQVQQNGGYDGGGWSNIFFGHGSGNKTNTGTFNIGLGPYSLNKMSSGTSNTALGNRSLMNFTTGSGNTVIGRESGSFLQTGSNNVFVGESAARSSQTGQTVTTHQSVAVGGSTRFLDDNTTNEVVIGYGAIGNGAHSVTLGNDSITKTIIKGSIGLGTVTPKAKLHIVGDGSAKNDFFDSAYTNIASYRPRFTLQRARGTELLPLAVNADDSVGSLNFSAHDGTNFRDLASLSTNVADDLADGMGGYLKFSTMAKGISDERMRIHSNGNIGIGTANPTTRLHIVGTSKYDDDITLQTHTDAIGDAPGLMFKKSRGTGSVPSQLTNDELIGLIGFRGWESSENWAYLSKIQSRSVGALSGRLEFFTTLDGTQSENLTIAENGNVGVGNTNPTEKLHVVGNIFASGTVSQSSDIRLKNEIEDITNPLKKLLNLRTVSYGWKNKNDHNHSRQIGLIAQEVREEFPEAVIEDNKGFLSVSYSSLISPVIGAIKEIYKKLVELTTSQNEMKRALASDRVELEELKKENNKLEAENEEMRKRLAKIEKALGI